MSSWVFTVLTSFGKALLISLSILVGACCLRLFYRFWTKRMACYKLPDDTSESCKYEMELQWMQEMNHMMSSHSTAHDAISEIELPPSPGANTSCPPYCTHSMYRLDSSRLDDFSDSYSGTWQQHPTPDGGETTDAELASFAGETTTVCSILTSNEDNLDIREPSLIQPESQPSPLPPEIPPHPKSRQSPTPSMLSEFPDYQGYENMVVKMPAPSASHDRGTELFLSQYYKALEQEQDNTRPSPPKTPL